LGAAALALSSLQTLGVVTQQSVLIACRLIKLLLVSPKDELRLAPQARWTAAGSCASFAAGNPRGSGYPAGSADLVVP
jgi:hypothetical protein